MSHGSYLTWRELLGKARDTIVTHIRVKEKFSKMSLLHIEKYQLWRMGKDILKWFSEKNFPQWHHKTPNSYIWQSYHFPIVLNSTVLKDNLKRNVNKKTDNRDKKKKKKMKAKIFFLCIHTKRSDLKRMITTIVRTKQYLQYMMRVVDFSSSSSSIGYNNDRDYHTPLYVCGTNTAYFFAWICAESNRHERLM